MGFFKKLRFWKRRRNVAVTTSDIGIMTDNMTSETGTQVSSIVTCEAYTETHGAVTTHDVSTMTTQDSSEMNDAGTQVDTSLTCNASTQTSKGNKQPKERIDGAAEEENEQMKRKIAEMEKLLEEKDRQIEKLNATVHEMKEKQSSEIQYIETKEEIEKSSLLHKISGMKKEITSVKERRPPSTERDTEDIGRNRNSPPRLQRTDLPPRLQRTDLRHRLQRTDLPLRLQPTDLRHRLQRMDVLPRLQRTDLPPRQQRTNLPPRLQRTDSGEWRRGWL